MILLICTTKQIITIPYKFHKADDFSLVNLSTEEEPEEPLEELIAQYEALCKNHRDHRLSLQELAKPYTCVKTINGKENMVMTLNGGRRKMWKLSVLISVVRLIAAASLRHMNTS